MLSKKYCIITKYNATFIYLSFSQHNINYQKIYLLKFILLQNISKTDIHYI